MSRDECGWWWTVGVGGYQVADLSLSLLDFMDARWLQSSHANTLFIALVCQLVSYAVSFLSRTIDHVAGKLR
jgi:hypothetical protein